MIHFMEILKLPLTLNIQNSNFIQGLKEEINWPWYRGKCPPTFIVHVGKRPSVNFILGLVNPRKFCVKLCNGFRVRN